jgi:hypothetical protein
MLILRNLTMEGWTSAYGTGLFVGPIGTKIKAQNPLNFNQTGISVGHGGEAYGFKSQ